MAEVIRGDTTMWDIAIVGADDLPLNLTGCSVWVTVKTSADQPDSEALYQHTLTVSGAGATTHTDGLSVGTGGVTAGIVDEELTPAESALFATGDYVYDIQVMLANGRIYTPVLGGEETVVADLTRDITKPEVIP